MRQLISSGSPFEGEIGFSRAVRQGSHVFVAGTSPVMPAGVEPPRDTYGQMDRALEIVLEALASAGARPSDVVRTRTFLTPAADSREAGRAHGEVFGEIRPASTMLVVTALLDPRWMVEVEAEALLDA